MKKSFLFLGLLILIRPQLALAHCPLCTIGAGGAALMATWLGVSTLSIGLFIGAFALAMGLWMLRLIQKKWPAIPGMLKLILALCIFLLTIVPIMPLMPGYNTISIFWMGGYGSLLNRTYLMNSFLIGSGIGAFILYLTPFLSQKITQWRHKKQIPFQGMLLIFILLLLTAISFEILL